MGKKLKLLWFFESWGRNLVFQFLFGPFWQSWDNSIAEWDLGWNWKGTSDNSTSMGSREQSWRRTNARALIRLIFLDMTLNTTQSPYGTCQKLSDILEAPFSEIVTNVVLVASYSVSTMKKEEFEVMTVSYSAAHK